MKYMIWKVHGDTWICPICLTEPMFWEIFAIYYVKSYRVTKGADPHYCYDLLLEYANDMKDLRKIDRLNFSEWYARKEFEE